MISRILFLLAAAFVAELYVLVQFGQRFGFGSTLLLVFVTAIIGTSLARREGLGAWTRLQTAIAQGRKPDAEILDGVIIVASAALLLLPGFLSDIVGLLGLLPFTRPLVRRELSRRIKLAGTGTTHVDAPNPGVTRDQPYATTFGGTARDRPQHASHDQSGVPR